MSLTQTQPSIKAIPVTPVQLPYTNRFQSHKNKWSRNFQRKHQSNGRWAISYPPPWQCKAILCQHTMNHPFCMLWETEGWARTPLGTKHRSNYWMVCPNHCNPQEKLGQYLHVCGPLPFELLCVKWTISIRYTRRSRCWHLRNKG